MPAATPLPTFDLDQTLPGGFRFPARMTALPLGGGGLALVSPIPMDDALMARIAALGEVRYLVAPNLFHHLYLGAAAERYPGARVLVPGALRKKRPDLRIDGGLEEPLPEDLARAVEVVPVTGAPVVEEHVFFHREARALVVADLVFNVTAPRGLAAHVLLRAAGCHGKLAQSRSWRFFVKDRARAVESVARILALPFDSVVPAHGDIVTENARPALAGALERLTR